MANVGFLQPDNEQIRRQVRGILDSYNNDWDILAELSQNALDAIVREGPPKGRVSISIDSVNKIIEIEDNGTGIDPESLTRLLRPFSSDKGPWPNQIGQKGVGLSFVIFTSSSFEIFSKHSNGDRTGTIRNAASWLAQDTEDDLWLELSETSPHDGNHGTRIRIIVDDREHQLFKLTRDQVEFALKTRTAIGNTGHIWGQPFPGYCEFTHTDLGGGRVASVFDCNYLLPTAGLAPHEFILCKSGTLGDPRRTDLTARSADA